MKLQALIAIYTSVTSMMERLFAPVLLFIMRLWMAKIFWQAGLTKIADWNSTVMLFQYEYKVPIIPAEIAALFATSFEMICPVLLTIGLFSRLATLPMLAMTAVIQFTYLDLTEHYYWAMLLGIILCYGPGPISIDAVIKSKFVKNKSR